jgi:hypothetical protein
MLYNKNYRQVSRQLKSAVCSCSWRLTMSMEAEESPQSEAATKQWMTSEDRRN